MAVSKSPWRVAADEFMSDGQWHEREEIINVMIRMVPPSRAIRVRRRQVNHTRKCRGSAGVGETRTLDEEVATGALQLANQAFWYAVKSRTWELDGNRLRLASKERGTC